MSDFYAVCLLCVPHNFCSLPPVVTLTIFCSCWLLLLTCCALPRAGGLAPRCILTRLCVHVYDMSMCASGVHACVPNKGLRVRRARDGND